MRQTKHRKQRALLRILLMISFFFHEVSHAQEPSPEDSKVTNRINQLKTSLKNNANNPDLLIQLAKLMDQVGRQKEAVLILQKARAISPDYEDVYLLEAIMLSKLNDTYACQSKGDLERSYYHSGSIIQQERFDAFINSIDKGYYEIEVGSGYDDLSNNRGYWTSNYLAGKYVDCLNNRFYGGYESVERYSINDEEYHLGLSLPFEYHSFTLEYRTSTEHAILPKETLYGQFRFSIGNSAAIETSYMSRDYVDIKTTAYGLGLDYYVSNYQIVIAREWNQTEAQNKEFSPAIVDKLYLTYYFEKYKYIGLNYVQGTELNYDQSDDPPRGEIRTLVLKGLYPLTRHWSLNYEVKRHKQIGYFDQNGIRLGVRYRSQ